MDSRYASINTCKQLTSIKSHHAVKKFEISYNNVKNVCLQISKHWNILQKKNLNGIKKYFIK
jgi:hypothetical protein